jgi:type IV fimbrial biogenesis protein FimT
MSASTVVRGFSLYELLMTLVLISVVLSIGVPSFDRILAEQRLRTEVDRLFHAVHLARKASVVRRREVTICPSRDGERCDADGAWSRGWILFVNTDRDKPPVRDENETLLQARRIDGQVRLSANRRGFSFRSTVLRATNGTLVFCDRAQRVENRALVVSYTGRPRVTRTDSRGKAYQCSN